MPEFNVSCNTVQRCLHSVWEGGFIKDGAEFRKSTVLGRLLLWLMAKFNPSKADQEVHYKEDRLFAQTNQISGNIINATIVNGVYTCCVTFHDKQFSITQSRINSKQIEICDLATNEKAILKNIPFPELKKRVLEQYVQEQRDQCKEHIDLSSFDLTGINLSDIDFRGTLLSRENVVVLLAQGKKLEGAKLAKDADLSDLQIGEAILNKATARWLIMAGAHSASAIWEDFFFNSSCNNVATDLENAKLLDEAFQMTQSIVNSAECECVIAIGDKKFTIKQGGDSAINIVELGANKKGVLNNFRWDDFKKCALQQYIREQHHQSGALIDLSGFTLAGLDLSDINFANTLLSRENFDAITAAGASLAYAQLKPDAVVTNLCIDGLALDKTMAKSLIKAGVDVKSVLINYLATEPSKASCVYKTKLLARYLGKERDTQRLRIDLSEFDLSDINCKDIDFSRTTLSQANVEAIIATGGNLTGAKLAIGTRAPTMYLLDEFALDKSMAIQLIEAGANPTAVLKNYLATERKLRHTNIDISGMDLTRAHASQIDLRNVNVEGVEFAKKKIRSVSENNDYVKTVQKNFQKDLLALLAIYSTTINEVIKHSSSRDIASIDKPIANAIVSLSLPTRYVDAKYLDNLNRYLQQSSEDLVMSNEVQRNFETHHKVIEEIRHADIPYSQKMNQAIKASTANCGEMAEICKSMLDLYLGQSLVDIGYTNFEFQSRYIYAAETSEHSVVRFWCRFRGVESEFIIDPWSDGAAWQKEKGIKYFQDRKPDKFTQPDVTFRDNPLKNFRLEQPAYRSAIATVFMRSQVKRQLDVEIKKHRSQFVGLPSM